MSLVFFVVVVSSCNREVNIPLFVIATYVLLSITDEYLTGFYD
jgi:hypothetical protein